MVFHMVPWEHVTCIRYLDDPMWEKQIWRGDSDLRGHHEVINRIIEITFFSAQDNKNAADWKSNLKIPPKDRRIKTAVCYFSLM